MSKPVIPLDAGRLVYSKQGRDKGRSFLVTAVLDETHVLIEDGSLRRREKPKKKKNMHLHARPYRADDIAKALAEGAPLTDSDIRKALEKALQTLAAGVIANGASAQTSKTTLQTTLNEEECPLVKK